jgi:hypothetical protein
MLSKAALGTLKGAILKADSWMSRRQRGEE